MRPCQASLIRDGLRALSTLGRSGSVMECFIPTAIFAPNDAICDCEIERKYYNGNILTMSEIGNSRRIVYAGRREYKLLSRTGFPVNT